MPDLHMMFFAFFVIPVLLLITAVGAKAIIESREEDKEIHRLAEEARRNNVKPLDDY
jgi:hypothetical protein